MRELYIGSKRFTKVVVLDEPGAGGACHEYSVRKADVFAEGIGQEYAHIYFQNGPIKENGVNGCHQEDLLVIVIDQLRGFQSGEFKCIENEVALRNVESALFWLKERTKDRIDRGAEGTNKAYRGGETWNKS